MTKTSHNELRQGLTMFSAGSDVLISEHMPRLLAANKSTAPNIASSDAFLRAQYVAGVSSREAQVLVSVNPQQISQRLAIRGMNDELQGRSPGISSTSLDI